MENDYTFLLNKHTYFIHNSSEQNTEQDVHKLVKALANNNQDINLRPNTLLAAIRKQVLNDPLLEGSMLKERLE